MLGWGVPAGAVTEEIKPETSPPILSAAHTAAVVHGEEEGEASRRTPEQVHYRTSGDGSASTEADHREADVENNGVGVGGRGDASTSSDSVASPSITTGEEAAAAAENPFQQGKEIPATVDL